MCVCVYVCVCVCVCVCVHTCVYVCVCAHYFVVFFLLVLIKSTKKCKQQKFGARNTGVDTTYKLKGRNVGRLKEKVDLD